MQTTGEAGAKRSRRGLIAGAGAVLAALAGKSLVDPRAAKAGTDGDVVLGSAVNDGGGFQTAITSTNPFATFIAYGQSDNNGGGALYGRNNANEGPGVRGYSVSGDGVQGEGEGDANGVSGLSKSSRASGVVGTNTNGGFGVAGRSDEPGEWASSPRRPPGLASE